MKKIISLLLFFVMLLPCVCVHAASVPSLDFMKSTLDNKNYSDVEQNGTISFKLNKPFSILEDNKEVSSYVDAYKIFNSIFDSKMTISSKTKVTDSGKKISAYSNVKSNIPLKLNNNFEADIKLNQTVWSDIDCSDIDNISYKMIMSNPQSAKYITLDDKLLLDNEEEMHYVISQIYSLLFDNDRIGEINDKLVYAIYNHATVTGNSKNAVIKFDDLGLKLYIVDVFKVLISEIDESLIDEIEIEEVEKALASVQIFGKDALVLRYTLDSKGRVTKQKIELNVDFNIYDFVKALGEETEEITKDNAVLDFTISSDISIKYNTVKIEKPEITEENSIDILEFNDPYYYDTVDDDLDFNESEDIYYPCTSANVDTNCLVDDKVEYVQLRSLLDGMDYNIHYENGKIYAETENEYAKYNSINYVIGSDVVYTDVGEVKLLKAMFVKDGITYIYLDDAAALSGMDVDSIYYSYSSLWGYVEFWLEEYSY